MKVIALSKKPRVYIPKEFRDEPNPPEFKLRSITRHEMLQIQASNPNKIKIGGDIAKLQDVLKSLDVQKSEDINDEALAVLADLDFTPMVEASLTTLSIHIKVLEIALSGWNNVHISEAEILPFNKDDIDCLDEKIIAELANEAMGTITDEEAENLEEVSTSQSGPESKDGTVETA